MLAVQWRVVRAGPACGRGNGGYRFRCRAQALSIRCYGGAEEVEEASMKKKVIVVGSGWAGLGAAHHLCKQVEFFPLPSKFWAFCLRN